MSGVFSSPGEGQVFSLSRIFLALSSSPLIPTCEVWDKGRKDWRKIYFDSAGTILKVFSWLRKRLFLSGSQCGSVETALGMTALYRLMTQAIPPPQHLPAEGTPTLGPGRGPWLLPSQGVDKGGSRCSHLTCEMWLCQPASHLQTHPGESQAPFSASKHGAWTQVGLFTCFLNAAFEKGRF